MGDLSFAKILVVMPAKAGILYSRREWWAGTSPGVYWIIRFRG
jgi:hypothetical protein